jgi:hypothetical protein
MIAHVSHTVSCPSCQNSFELFRSAWCGHANPSKLCPQCDRCACGLPGYENPLFWKDAPAIFLQNGFTQLFLLYL